MKHLPLFLLVSFAFTSSSARADGKPAPAAAMTSTEYRVTAQDIQNLIAGEGGVDLAPVLKNGKQVAMRVFGVSAGSTAARLGAKNDDVLESINGIALVSNAEAYRAGDVASREKRIVIRGKRAGHPFETVLLLPE